MKDIILLVEDNQTIRFNLKIFLEMEGFKIIEAENGEKALEKLEKLDPHPNLIISDIMMPIMDGYEFYSVVSDNPNWNAIPFIFLTAKASEDDVRFGKELGVDDYLTKPINNEDLLATIKGKIKRSKKNKAVGNKFKEKLLETPEKSVQVPEIEENFINFFIVDWDEMEGPILKHEYPPIDDNVLSIETISLNLFMISQNMYGLEGIKEASDLLINLPNTNKDSYIYFDHLSDSQVRGGSRPYMLGVIAEKIHYLASMRIKEILHEVSQKIKNNEEWSKENAGNKIRNILDIKKKKLKAFWIFKDIGTEMYSFAPNIKLDKDLLTNFLSAMQGFTYEMSKKNMEALTIGDDRFHFYYEKEDEFYVLGLANRYYNENSIIISLKEIAKEFKNMFADELTKKLQNYTKFREFDRQTSRWISI